MVRQAKVVFRFLNKQLLSLKIRKTHYRDLVSFGHAVLYDPWRIFFLCIAFMSIKTGFRFIYNQFPMALFEQICHELKDARRIQKPSLTRSEE